MGCSQNGAMQGPGMVHRPRVRLCAAEGQHGAAWSHGTAQRLQVHKNGHPGPAMMYHRKSGIQNHFMSPLPCLLPNVYTPLP